MSGKDSAGSMSVPMGRSGTLLQIFKATAKRLSPAPLRHWYYLCKVDTSPLSYLLAIVDKYFARSEFWIILDVGSLDGLDALRLKRLFPHARVYAFECHPELFKRMQENVALVSYVRIFPQAVCDVTGQVPFYVHGLINRPDVRGSSSLLLLSEEWRLEEPGWQTYEPIMVPSVTLADWADGQSIQNIDLIWMDLQGGEGKALAGLKGRLQRVKVIVTEVEFLSIYEGQPLLKDIDALLKPYFSRVHLTPAAYRHGKPSFANAVYVNNRYM